MSPSSPDDPFAEVDTGRTFIMPTPGGRTTAMPSRPQHAPQHAAGADVAADIGPSDSGLNPLVALVPQIRASTQLADPASLRESIAQGLREFEAQARARGITPERVLAA